MAGVRRYDTDLTDEQWERIREVVTRRSELGRPTSVDLREVVNALRYMTRTGCQLRLLPKDFPGWTTVRYDFDLWTWDHRLQELNKLMRQELRVWVGRQPERQDDRGRRRPRLRRAELINGRKRFLLVDTIGNVLLVRVTSADTPEREGAQMLLWREGAKLARLLLIWAAGAHPASGPVAPAVA